MPPSPKEVETVTEYRVEDVDDARFSRRFPVVPNTSYQAACDVLHRLRWAGNKHARIEVRTVTTTPWEDVTEANQETKGKRNE